ncbi:MAG: histidine kinase [Gammaproteobacteria bacterium]|nr:MAG: histidine kinase [Gammaproteobacteria bacterium]
MDNTTSEQATVGRHPGEGETTFDRAEERTNLNLFLGYRVVVATVMVILFFAIKRGPLGTHGPELFGVVAVVYSVLALSALMWNLARPLHVDRQAILAVVIDIAAFTLMMQTSGGVASGLGILTGISLTLAATLLEARFALGLAALATLAVLVEELWSELHHAFPATRYVEAGFLGIAYFALVLLSVTLTARARRSEELVEQRETELVNLAQLSDYVIQQMQSGIVVIDREEQVQLLNEAAWSLLGMPTQMRHHPLRAVSPRLAEAHATWREDPERSVTALRALPEGRDLRVQFNRLGRGGSAGTLIILEDTSRLTQQAQQMKLASLGRLTAGIAHEVRNPLGAISHAAQLLGEAPELSDTDHRLVDIIQQNSARVNEIIENILRLSRQDLPHPKPLVLGPWLDTVVEALRGACGLSAEQLGYEVEPYNTTIHADPGQLQQILEILCDNAKRHFPGDAGDLRILILAGANQRSGGPFIELQDNGGGIPGDVADKLFEPFFTTRNEGTGLGLYIARQLCEANRARIEYHPLPQGAAFRLSFPNSRRRTLT